MEVSAISNPHFPLAESEQKKLVKLYLNDVGLLTHLLYGLNVNAVLQDLKSINLGTVYESVVAQELAAHGFKLHYYDNKKKGEVDFLVDDHDHLKALVFSNEREIFKKKGVTYLPIYYSMFLQNEQRDEPVILPELESVPQ